MAIAGPTAIPWRFIAPLILAAAAITAALAILGWPGDRYLEGDYMQYYAGSRAILEGASPYDHAWWADFHARVGSRALQSPLNTGDPNVDWTTPYPLPAFLVLLPLALFPLRVAEPLFAVGELLFVLAASFVLARVVLKEPRRDAPVALALVAASQPLWILVAGGNASGFAAAAFALALAGLLAGRPALAGALIAGCIIKPHLFILASLVLAAASAPGDRRRMLLSAGVTAGVLFAIGFALEPTWVGDWLREAGRLQNTTFSNATGWTMARPFVVDFRSLSAALTLALVAVFAVWYARTRPPLALAVAAAMPVSVLIAPHGWSYDYLALVPTAVVGVALAAASRRRPLALAAIAVLAVLVPWLLYSVAFQRNGEELSAWWLVLVAIVVMAAATPRVRAAVL